MNNTETYLTGQFIDYKGRLHPYVICAIVEDIDNREKSTIVANVHNKTYELVLDDKAYLITRKVKIGYAICNPDDEFIEAKGMELAKQRALEGDKQLLTSSSGIINHTVIEALLQQESNFIKENPGVFIKGYSAAKKKYINAQNNKHKKREYIVNEKNIKRIIDILCDPNSPHDFEYIASEIFGTKN